MLSWQVDHRFSLLFVKLVTQVLEDSLLLYLLCATLLVKLCPFLLPISLVILVGVTFPPFSPFSCFFVSLDYCGYMKHQSGFWKIESLIMLLAAWNSTKLTQSLSLKTIKSVWLKRENPGTIKNWWDFIARKTLKTKNLKACTENSITKQHSQVYTSGTINSSLILVYKTSYTQQKIC